MNNSLAWFANGNKYMMVTSGIIHFRCVWYQGSFRVNYPAQLQLDLRVLQSVLSISKAFLTACRGSNHILVALVNRQKKMIKTLRMTKKPSSK